MENLKQFTSNLSLNPYTHSSSNTIENNELYTANKSIIRAINEIYLNQKSIFNSIMYFYKKFDITIGDIIENKELKNAYSSLQFANIIDGLIKLNDKINLLSDVNLQNNKIVEILNIIKNENIKTEEIFNTMNWDNIIDALLKIDKKISDYILEDTESEALEYTAIRDSISNLVSIVGSENEENKNILTEKFNNIINAIITLDTFVGPSDEALQQLNESGYVSILHAVNEFGNRIASIMETVSTINYNQTINNNNFNKINETIESLSTDLETFVNNTNNNLQSLTNNISAITGSNTVIQNLGYSDIADGLVKLAATNSRIIEIIGDLDNSTDSHITKYKELKYKDIIDAIVDLNKLIYTITTKNQEELENFNSSGFENMISAINHIITLLGIPEKNLSNITEKNYTSIIDAIVKITDSINNLQQSIQSQNQLYTEQQTKINNLNNLNTNLSNNLSNHISDKEAHPDCISGYFRHKTNHFYQEGEIVFVPELPNNLCLVCINSGVTGSESPKFKEM